MDDQYEQEAELSVDEVKLLRSRSESFFEVPPSLQNPSKSPSKKLLQSNSQPTEPTKKEKLTQKQLTVTGQFFKFFETDMPERAANVIAAIPLDKPVAKDDLAKVFQQRMGTLERLCSRIVPAENGEGFFFERMPSSWTPADNIYEETMESGHRSELIKRCESLVMAPFDQQKPAWELHLLQNPGLFSDGESALIFRTSHVIGDGSSLVMTLISLTDDLPSEAAAPAPSKKRAPPSCFSRLGMLAHNCCVALPSCCAALNTMFNPTADDDTDLKGPVGGCNTMTKNFRIFKVPLDKAKAISCSGSGSCTVNEVAVAAVAGGIRRFLLKKQDPLLLAADSNGGAYPRLSSAILVGLAVKPQLLMFRSSKANVVTLQNKIAIMDMPLPMLKSSEERIGVVVRESNRLKRTLIPHCMGCMLPGLMKMMGPKKIVDMAMASKERPKRTTTVSNVPGPQRQLLMTDARVKDIAFWNNPGEQAFNVTFFSYNGSLNTMVSYHPQYVEGDLLTQCLQDEWSALLGVDPVTWT